ncbi:MAG: hypothetical protein EPN82_04490 [Bacteroidetes bacterium]|nr:MAG: hypothetical protein EPN82_04490 [Bacteroidota bacterium]
MKYLLFLLFSFSLFSEASAQCCSVGSPVGGTTSIGTLPQNNFRYTLFYRYGYGNRYYIASELVNDTKINVKQAFSNYVGLFIDYGLLNRLTITGECGYYINKVQDWGEKGQFEASGLSSAVLMGKYNLLNDIESEFEITAGMGIKIPFTSKRIQKNGVDLPRDVQPSPGAFGFVSQLYLRKGFSDISANLFLVNRIEINGSNEDDLDYRYGNCYNTSFFITKKIVDNLIGILQIRNEIKEKDRDNFTGEISTSGSNLFFFSPQINYSFGDLSVSALYDLPVYRYYNNRQLGGKYSFALNFIWQMDLSGN